MIGGALRFHKGLVSLGEEFGVGFRWMVGGGLPVRNERKEDRRGEGGVGTGKRTRKSMDTCLAKQPFSKLPSSFSLVPEILQRSRTFGGN